MNDPDDGPGASGRVVPEGSPSAPDDGAAPVQAVPRYEPPQGFSQAIRPESGALWSHAPQGSAPQGSLGSPPGLAQTEVLSAGPPAAPPRDRSRLAGLLAGGLVLVLMVIAAGLYLLRDTGDGLAGADQPAMPGSAVPTSPTDRPAPLGAGPGLPAPSGPGPSGPVTQPPAGWTIPVNAYCREADRQLKAVPAPKSDAEQASTLHQLASIVRAMNTRLHGMTVPADQKAAYDAMMSSWEEVPGGYDEAAAAAEKGDANAYQLAMARSSAANDEGNSIAHQIGLGDCADAGGLPDASQQPSPSTV